jgi:D-alanyl-D-alanine carboxypeptidase
MMKKLTDESFLADVTKKMINNRSVYGAILCVESGDGSLSWNGSAGDLDKEDRYFIASVTKLYITTVILKLRNEGRLILEDQITLYFPDGYLDGLHNLKGVDYTGEITITHLLSNTSGIPDYFSDKQGDGKKAADDLFGGMDEPWPLEKTLGHVKNLTPKFRPGQKGKAQYSDTNFQLLGRIIETITGKELAEVFHEYIFDELELADTYAYRDVNDDSPAKMYYKTKQLHLPNYIASVTAEGGIVSTAKEVMVFLKAFFNGRFFPAEDLEALKKWNLIWFPGQFYFGVGLEKLWTPRVLSPFKPIGELLGCWGQSGAFAFHNPENDLYFTGTVNQLSGFGHSAAFRAMIKIIKAC